MPLSLSCNLVHKLLRSLEGKDKNRYSISILKTEELKNYHFVSNETRNEYVPLDVAAEILSRGKVETVVATTQHKDQVDIIKEMILMADGDTIAAFYDEMCNSHGAMGYDNYVSTDCWHVWSWNE